MKHFKYNIKKKEEIKALTQHFLQHAQNRCSGQGKKCWEREDNLLQHSDLDRSKTYQVKMFRAAMENVSALSSISALRCQTTSAEPGGFCTSGLSERRKLGDEGFWIEVCDLNMIRLSVDIPV